MRISFSVALALAAGLITAPVQAQVVGDPAVVENLLESYGLKVTSGEDGSGYPKLSSRIEGTNFDVYFYGCKEGRCDSVQFVSGFNLEKPMLPARINDWNRDNRYGRAYLDSDGDPLVEYDVNLDFEGVGAKNFDDSIDIWRIVLGEFRNFINY